MSGERHTAEMNGLLAEMDEDLKAALSVSPSAGFEARVLERVGGRRAVPRRERNAYVLAAAAALVVATAVGVLMQRSRVERQVREPAMAGIPASAAPSATPATESSATVPPAATPAEPSRSRGISPRPGVRRLDRRVVAASVEPEVIVPRQNAEAVRRLVRDIAEKRIDLPAAGAPAVPAPPAALVVTPLSVKPISIPAVERRGGVTPVVRGLESRSRT